MSPCLRHHATNKDKQKNSRAECHTELALVPVRGTVFFFRSRVKGMQFRRHFKVTVKPRIRNVWSNGAC
jgi:hypothetical protein